MQHQHDLIYGGGRVGLMGIIADTVLKSNRHVIGVMPEFLIAREIAHPHLTQLIRVNSMSERKHMMLELSDVCIALPGGPGTLEEISEAISWARIAQSTNRCLFYNVNGNYEPLKMFFQSMVTEGFLSEQDFNAIGFVNSVDEIEAFLSS